MYVSTTLELERAIQTGPDAWDATGLIEVEVSGLVEAHFGRWTCTLDPRTERLLDSREVRYVEDCLIARAADMERAEVAR